MEEKEGKRVYIVQGWNKNKEKVYSTASNFGDALIVLDKAIGRLDKQQIKWATLDI